MQDATREKEKRILCLLDRSDRIRAAASAAANTNLVAAALLITVITFSITKDFVTLNLTGFFPALKIILVLTSVGLAVPAVIRAFNTGAYANGFVSGIAAGMETESVFKEIVSGLEDIESEEAYMKHLERQLEEANRYQIKTYLSLQQSTNWLWRAYSVIVIFGIVFLIEKLFF